MIQCESHNAFVRLLATTDMLGIVPRRVLTLDAMAEALQEIRVAEALPALTVGMFTRADTPLTPVAEAMAKALAKVGRQLAFSR